MNVHPERRPTSASSLAATFSSGKGLSNKIRRSFSTTFDKADPTTGQKPTSPTKSKFSLSPKKSLTNVRPTPTKNSMPEHVIPLRSSSLNPPRRESSKELAIDSSQTGSNPTLGRSTSTPDMHTHSIKKNSLQSGLEPINERPQLPPILPSISLSEGLISDVLSSEAPHDDLQTMATSPTIRSPSTTSISSSNTFEDADTPLDIRTFLAAPRLTQRVRLKTGRVVSFSEVGDRNGFPVFVFLGMGCVRYFIAFFDDLASSYGLRLICPDRPGVGLSDNVKVEEQQVLKWPEVIEELCDMLGIKKFFIMAHSAGAPYALACALKMPERLRGNKIYLVCPWVSTQVANNFKWLRFVPTPIMKLTNTAGISLQQMLYGRQPYSTKPIHRNSGALASPMSSLEKKQQLGLAILKASFAENLAGANNDLLMCFERRHTFGFSYTDVNHPVHVFHGTKDERIPVAAVKWMEENMPDCELTLIEGGKHSLLLRAEVVDTIFKSIAMQLHDKNECRVCKISSKCWLMEESIDFNKEPVAMPPAEVTEQPRSRRRSLPVKVKKFNSKKPSGKTELERNQVPKSGEKLVAVYSYF